MEIIRQNCKAMIELSHNKDQKQIEIHIDNILKRINELKNV